MGKGFSNPASREKRHHSGAQRKCLNQWSMAGYAQTDNPTHTKPISADQPPHDHTRQQEQIPMIQLRLSNDRTKVDMHSLATAFGLSREALDGALSLGTISYWYELGPGDSATPRTVFHSIETGQRVALDRTGKIMAPEDEVLADQPLPCAETCRPGATKAHAADA
ncbi:MAG: hypothetical protein H5U14_07770, partial [Roseovarius sp.]|nr:hypothetical protein [Roseovarius sp.]